MGKKDLKERIDNSEPILDEINLKILGKIGKSMKKYTKIAWWMLEHFDNIFAKAPNNEEYAVGIWEKRGPRILYFNDKNSPKCLAVLRSHPAYLMYRGQDNFQ